MEHKERLVKVFDSTFKYFEYIRTFYSVHGIVNPSDILAIANELRYLAHDIGDADRLIRLFDSLLEYLEFLKGFEDIRLGWVRPSAVLEVAEELLRLHDYIKYGWTSR